MTSFRKSVSCQEVGKLLIRNHMKDSLSAHSVRGTANPASVLLIKIIKSNTAEADEIAGLMFLSQEHLRLAKA